MLTKKQIENSRMAYSIMAGIPADLVNLDVERDHSGPDAPSDAVMKKGCGSVGCIGGWISAHQFFKRQGLSFADKKGGVNLKGVGSSLGDMGLALFGDVHILSASLTNLSAKREALARIRNHLHNYGVISDERNAELAAAEHALCEDDIVAYKGVKP